MRKEKPDPQLLQEARDALSALYSEGGSQWTYPRIADRINEVTGRTMDGGLARRFIIDDPKQPLFSILEAKQVHIMAVEALNELHAQIQNPNLSDIAIDFNKKAGKVDVSVSLNSPRARRLDNDPEFKKLLLRNVEATIDLYLSLPASRPKGPV